MSRDIRTVIYRGGLPLLSLLLAIFGGWARTGETVAAAPLAPAEGFSYRVDPDLCPRLETIPGLGGEPERTVAAVLSPNGVQTDFVVDEIIFSVSDPEALGDFLSTYEASVLFGGSLPAPPDGIPPDRVRWDYSTSEDYLLRVNLDRADLSGFTTWMEQLGFTGEYVFSSEDAVRLFAIFAKERALNDREVTINLVAYLPPLPTSQEAMGKALAQPNASSAPASADCVLCRTEEYTITSGYANSFAFSWLNDADLQVTRAWQYYDLLELSPSSPPVLAMVDLGFAQSPDFPAPVYQYDFQDEVYSVYNKPNTVTGARWHGTGTAGIAAARPNNRYGTAGTGGLVASLYFFRPEWTFFGIGLAIRTAVHWGADVVNVSAAADTDCMFFWAPLRYAANRALSAGVIVLTPAGNEGKNMDDEDIDIIPCEVPGILCVGGIDIVSKQAIGYSNYGSSVDIWGPANGLMTTPNPDSGGNLAGFGGTCGASAYMAGIITLMRAISPTLDYNGAVSLLRNTAHHPSDPKVSSAGYVNAYAAIKAVAASAGYQPRGDSYEPNDTPGTATLLSPGTYTATIAPGDTDYFSFADTDYVDVQLRITYDDRATPYNGLSAALGGSQGTTSGGTINLDRTFLPPGKYLAVTGQSPDTINCYHIDYSKTASTIPPDRFDDRKPAGEPRNDTYADRAVIQQAVQANPIAPGGAIYDLNFDVIGDTDFFEVQLPPATDPTTGHSECLQPGTWPYGEPGFYQGRVTIVASPDPGPPSTTAEGYAWPFELKVYTATGTVFTSTTGLNLTIECPHRYFPDGRIRFSVRGKDGRRNFYRIYLHYTRWDHLLDVPDWVWTLTRPPLVRVLPPYVGLIRWVYPFDPDVIAQWVEGSAPNPLPAEYAVFHWEEAGDLDLYLLTEGNRYLEMTLYDTDQQVIATTSVGGVAGMGVQALADDGHIHVPDLPAGTYVLAFGPGDMATLYGVSIGPPYRVHLPLVVRGRTR